MIVIINKTKIKNIQQIKKDVKGGTETPRKIFIIEEKQIFPIINKQKPNEMIIVINKDIKITKGLLKRLVGFSNRNPKFAIGTKGVLIVFNLGKPELEFFEGHKIRKSLPVDILLDCILTKQKFHANHDVFDELLFSYDFGQKGVIRLLVPTADLGNEKFEINTTLLDRYADEIKGGAKTDGLGKLFKRR